jgi:hypothetical protein
MIAAKWLAEDVAEEFSGADLKDPRRERRLARVASKLADDPEASFPDLFSSSAELEGFYRFLRNESFDWQDVLEPHLEATCGRAEQLGECLVIHDTTEFAFKGDRRGLGATSSKAQGFFAHASLLVALDEARTPLGLGALQQYARSGRKGRRLIRDRLDDETSEGNRWLKGAASVEERCRDRFSAIHVADREGDSYPFMSGIEGFEGRFVIRVAHDRCVIDDDEQSTRLSEIMQGLEPRAFFEIPLSPRGKPLNPTMARVHPSRRGRMATVCVAATTTTVRGPRSRRQSASTMELNLVRVWERNAPEGQPAVQWLLWTTEPIGTNAEIRKVVDIYRARWVIEEYFKALKTGCNFEKRQLESFDTLSTALTLFAPVAWKLLLARSVARNKPTWPATSILSPLQIRYLEKRYGKPIRTASAALAAMARLGGHLQQNGEPGWQTLGRGYEKLATGEAFCNVLKEQHGTCDQS